MEKKENYSLTYSVFLTQDKNENFNFYISKTYKVKSKKTSYNPKTESNSNSNFTGFIHIIDKEGDMVFAKKVINDKKDGKLFFNKEFKKKGLEYRVQEECNTVTTYHYTDHYTVFSISGSDDIWVYTGSTLNNISMEQQCNSYWLPDVNGGGGGNTPGKYKNTSGNNIYSDCNSNKSKNDLNKDESPCQIEISVEAIDCGIGYIYDNGIGECVLIDDQIINELTGKADCAYNKLLSSGISNFHNMIIDLFIEFGVGNIGGRDLTFEMSTDLPSNKGGKTVPDGNGNFTILINQNLMNTLSSIEVAAILIHEISHAFLDKHYNDYNSSFNELYIKYLKDTGYSGPIHHNIMEDNFIERMAIVLQNYDSSIFSNFEDYKILASQGVFELTDVQKDDLLAIKLISRNNDTNCD